MRKTALERGRIELGRGFLDVVTERLTQARGVLDRRNAGRVHRDAGRRRLANPMRSGPGSMRIASRQGRAGGTAAYGSPGIGPAIASSSRGAVAHAAGDHVLRGQPAQALGAFRAGADARTRRLQPEQAAGRGRDADRAAAIGRMGERHDAGRHGGGRTAARAARREIGAPRVAGDAVEARFGRRREAELGRVRLAGMTRPARRKRATISLSVAGMVAHTAARTPSSPRPRPRRRTP